jgi:hypothetical protein
VALEPLAAMAVHMSMITFTIGIAALAAFGALSARYGVEQRPGFDERPERGPQHYGLR